MKLEEFARIYFENHEVGIRETTQQCYYLPAARQFDRTIKTPVESITKKTANAFVDWLKSTDSTPRTQYGRRSAFRTLWTAAHEAGMAPAVEPFRKIVVPKKSPIAWTMNTVQQLVTNVKLDKRDWINGIEFGLWWSSLFSAAWDSALRLGDLMSVENDWIQRRDGCGFLRIIQSKTQREHYVQFNQSTMQLINQSMVQCPKRRLIWPLRSNRRKFYNHMQTILKRNGIQGSFKYFRRSAVTWAESQQAGQGTKLANHRDSRTTRESYIDPQLMPDTLVVLPGLR